MSPGDSYFSRGRKLPVEMVIVDSGVKPPHRVGREARCFRGWTVCTAHDRTLYALCIYFPAGVTMSAFAEKYAASGSASRAFNPEITLKAETSRRWYGTAAAIA